MNVVVLHLACGWLLAGDPSDVKNDRTPPPSFGADQGQSIIGVIINQKPSETLHHQNPVSSALPPHFFHLPARYPAFGFGAGILFDRH
jgi:hypothetical protein